MRVIAGKAKGLKLHAPSTLKVRPATDKVKGALFNILGDLEGVKALDLLVGTRSVGIEGLSRRAGECSFVESDRRIAASIEKNLSHCGFEKAGRILTLSVPAGLKVLARKKHRFDLVFVDPPYDRNWVNPTLAFLEKSDLLSKAAVVVVEHSPREGLKPLAGLEVTDQRRYGQTHISFLKVRR